MKPKLVGGWLDRPRIFVDVYTGGVDAATYFEVAGAISTTDMVARGGFNIDATETGEFPTAPGGRSAAALIMVGNIGGSMWPRFRAAERPGPHPLDDWTRLVLQPLAQRFDATFVHPSDEPYYPFQRWAMRADAVWQSPIGLLIHPEHGLWHAYRGVFVLGAPVDDLPVPEPGLSPCASCVDRPCLTTCPVDAFSGDGYDHIGCRSHVARSKRPDCLNEGCAARCACPVNREGRYGTDQMRFHMEAFVGM